MRARAVEVASVPTVLRTAECVALVEAPPGSPPGRAWFAVGSARRVVSLVSVGLEGSAALEAFAALPSGATGPAGRSPEPRDDVISAVSWDGSRIAAGRGCGVGLLRAEWSSEASRCSLVLDAWNPGAAESAIESVASFRDGGTFVACGDEGGGASLWAAPSPLVPAAAVPPGREGAAAWSLSARWKAHESLCGAMASALPTTGRGSLVTGGHDHAVRAWTSASPRSLSEPLSLTPAAGPAPSSGQMANPAFVNALSASAGSRLLLAAAGDGAAWLLSPGLLAAASGRRAPTGPRPVPIRVTGSASFRAPAAAAVPAGAGASGVGGSKADGAGAAAAGVADDEGWSLLGGGPGEAGAVGPADSRGRLTAHTSPCVSAVAACAPGGPGGPPSVIVTAAMDGDAALWDSTEAEAWAVMDAEHEAACAAKASTPAPGGRRAGKGKGRRGKRAAPAVGRPPALVRPARVSLLGRFAIGAPVNQVAAAPVPGGVVVVGACPDAKLRVLRFAW